MLKQVTTTKTYFDKSILKIGTKIHIKRLMSCIYTNEERANCIYDIDDDAVIINIFKSDDDDCDEIDCIQIEFHSYRDEYNYDFENIEIDDVLSGEWKIELI